MSKNYNQEKPEICYGKIDYLYKAKSGTAAIGETIFFKTKESFMKEYHECINAGIPIKSTLNNDNEKEL
ncbi:hypothetical protein [Clostridium estertheticum]|uniref:hypothetical protein n=1 Tax=Clostridium estertheticum TaxID=238834 RepID=UPI001C0AFA24|nr:hypothetical protein [Clostridium estertheticum]MBU3186629.1 hypothetical protein [Clostridium estertheticum]